MGVARAWGFVGVSNDDASRALIAWDFARAPSLDPTRSSWLPAHTWVVGAAMSLARSPLRAPYAVSFAATAAAVWLAVRASVQRGASRAGAWGAAALLLAWRWSAWSGAAGCVPEMPTAALLLGAAVALGGGRTVLAGALAALACGHRYEAWFALAGMCLGVAWETRDRRALRFALVGLTMPALWLAINHARVGDALDFVRRVEAFRAREGAQPAGALRYPFVLAGELPHVVALAAAGVIAARRADATALGALGVLAGLVLGDARGGGPTHHAARALLAGAWLLAPSVARGIDALRGRWRLALVGVFAAALWRAPRAREVEGFVARDAVAAGDALRAGRGPWLIEGARQDHLWVMLRSGRPEDAVRDRAYGADAPSEAERARWAARGGLAAASSEGALNALRERGFRVPRGAVGAWRVARVSP